MFWQPIFRVFLLFSFLESAYLLSRYPIILIVSYDAFRYDYRTKEVTPVLKKLEESGTFAEYLDNVFVTKTFTNHHSIATGVYPEFHGILGNSLYDSRYKRKLDYSYEFWHYTNDILPIWIVNQMKGNGRHSGVMMWPGNEYEYSGVRPTYQKAWRYDVTWEKRIDTALKWILNPDKPANMVLLYIEEPDIHGHSFGVNTPKFKEELRKMDNITEYLLDQLECNNLTNHVNVFFVSDHGMISSTKKDVIDLRKIVPSNHYTIYESSPGIHIYPAPGKANAVYGALKKAVDSGSPFRVYKKADIPDDWHFKNNRRAPPIFAIANPPHVFHDFYKFADDLAKKWNFTATDDTPFGMHGYDNNYKLMKPYFLATGPNIKRNHQIEPFKTLDLFSLWSHMSGFPEYATKTNGSLDVVLKMLVKSDSTSYASPNYGSITTGFLLLAAVATFAIYFAYKKGFFRRKTRAGRFSHESVESRQRLLDPDEEA